MRVCVCPTILDSGSIGAVVTVTEIVSMVKNDFAQIHSNSHWNFLLSFGRQDMKKKSTYSLHYGTLLCIVIDGVAVWSRMRRTMLMTINIHIKYIIAAMLISA